MQLYDVDSFIHDTKTSYTNKLFVPPENYNVRVTGKFGMQYYAEEVAKMINLSKESWLMREICLA